MRSAISSTIGSDCLFLAHDADNSIERRRVGNEDCMACVVIVLRPFAVPQHLRRHTCALTHEHGCTHDARLQCGKRAHACERAARHRTTPHRTAPHRTPSHACAHKASICIHAHMHARAHTMPLADMRMNVERRRQTRECDTWTDRRTEERTESQTDGWTAAQTETDGRMDGRKNGRMHTRTRACACGRAHARMQGGARCVGG